MTGAVLQQSTDPPPPLTPSFLRCEYRRIGIARRQHTVPQVVRYERGRKIGGLPPTPTGMSFLRGSSSMPQLQPARSGVAPLPHAPSVHTMLSRPPPRAMVSNGCVQYSRPPARPTAGWVELVSPRHTRHTASAEGLSRLLRPKSAGEAQWGGGGEEAGGQKPRMMAASHFAVGPSACWVGQLRSAPTCARRGHSAGRAERAGRAMKEESFTGEKVRKEERGKRGKAESFRGKAKEPRGEKARKDELSEREERASEEGGLTHLAARSLDFDCDAPDAPADDSPPRSPRSRLRTVLRMQALVKLDAAREEKGKKFTLLVRSGLIARPTLQSKAQPWWTPPDEVVTAAKRWDERHRERAERAEATFKGLSARVTDKGQQVAFSNALHDVRLNRYFVHEKAFIQSAEGRVPKPRVVVARAWSLYDSIWKPRASYADSKDLHDTVVHLESCMASDFALALVDHDTRGYIQKHDPRPTAVQDVETALRESVDLVYSTFDYFACVGSGLPVGVNLNSYRLFVEQAGMIDKTSKWCSSAAFDQLFIAVNVGSADRHTMDRQRWVQLLIRLAYMRYLTKSAFTGNYGDALRHVLEQIEAKVDGRALHEPRAFRERHCYCEGVSEVLRDHLPFLRALFKVYALGQGAVGDRMRDTALMDFEEWRNLCRDFRFLDSDFTMRELQLTFLWSRMRVKDMRQKARLTQLHFEDFLEALVRVATTKTIPTDHHLQSAGFVDGGEFFLTMSSDPKLADDLESYVVNFAHRWDGELPQPAERAVYHLLKWLLRMVDAAVGHGGLGPTSEMTITEEKILKFRKHNGLGS
ncbi:hypothetical protein AB1Y20_006119 [Prymnesium parvum]|uniref:Uncharacterized protein n=1 Tax=Prymnesium parvum TaxID=97485 RepID=A0AB34J1R9_PRYPA